jgi:hypothetical protein
MWLALASIVLASAIGFNVIALWLTGWFERKQPESLLSERSTNEELSPHWTAAEGLSGMLAEDVSPVAQSCA